MAHGLRVTADQECCECVPRADQPPGEEEMMELTIIGSPIYRSLVQVQAAPPT